MVRSSVVSAVSSAGEIRLVPDWRCFWSTNSKRISSLAVPGSAATPCVAQLVLSTQNAEPQDAWAAPAAGSSASPQTIANGFFIFSSPEVLICAPTVRGRGAYKSHGRRRASHCGQIRKGKAGRARARWDRRRLRVVEPGNARDAAHRKAPTRAERELRTESP